MVVTEFGGNFMKLMKGIMTRLTTWSTDPSLLINDGWAERYVQAAAVGATGPP